MLDGPDHVHEQARGAGNVGVGGGGHGRRGGCLAGFCRRGGEGVGAGDGADR